MAKYIDKEKLIEELKDPPLCHSLGGMCMQDIFDIIDEMPEKDVAPVIHAHWKRNKWGNGYHRVCSNCGYFVPTDTYIDYIGIKDNKYCYNCGAIMDDAKGDENND